MPDFVRCAAIATLAALVACTPQLNGVCSSSAECHADETCSPDGLCLRKPDAGGPVVDGGPDAGSDGGPDAGSDAGPDAGSDAGPDDGGVDAGTDGGAQAVDDAGPDGVTVAAPAPGSFVRGGFAVAAVPGANVGAATDVTFLLNVTGSDAGLGQLAVAAPLSGSQTYSGNFSVADPSFGGSAVLRAVLHRAAGGAAVVSASVPLIVDQVAPQITTSWDGGPWVARDGGLQVTAAVSDDRSGVASASLRVEDGGTYAAQLDGGMATFNVPAAELFAAGAAVARPFSLLVGDRAGNAGVLPTSSALVLRVDDQPPTIVLAAIDSAQWRSGAFDLVGTLTDPASGVASASLLLGNTAIKGTAGAGGAWSFHATLGQTFPDFEGAAGFQVVAIDNAGNQADAGGIISVDTRPPAVLSVVPTTAPDYTAPDGKRWYKASGGTASITVQASIDGGAGSLIDPASLSASVDATSVGRNAQEPDFSFDLPRDAGQGFEGAKVVTVSAKDLAGNGPSVGTGSVNFDDQAPVLAAALASPMGWVRRSQPGGGVATTTIGVSLTENGSGVQSVRFRGGAAFAPAPAPAPAGLYGLSFDLSAAPQGAEGPLAFNVDASDFVGNQATRAYFFNVDDVAPSASADISNPLNSAWHSIAAGNLVFRSTVLSATALTSLFSRLVSAVFAFYQALLRGSLLDLRRTSLSTGLIRRDAEALFSGGSISVDTLTSETKLLRYSGEPEAAGILRKSSLRVFRTAMSTLGCIHPPPLQHPLKLKR